MTTLPDLQRRCFADSVAWFSEVHARGVEHLTVHYALGLAGEAGELANVVKKANRGDGPLDLAALAAELADVLIYACDLAELLGIDLERAIESKRAVLIDRWGEPQTLFDE